LGSGPKALAARLARHWMPKDLIHQLQTLIRSFGLDMASIDLRLTPEGDYYFFEINPSG
jgi:hypothetical protein